ncbi:response regulator [Puia dinghuensis]|uniref:Response regulator n=1 Tax=Puia dinghuensis TaxID=1792502 RepID=A0A8J2U815_9BACT|nr:response regulator [Puia dinghuensis]GGA85230.1 response regulator [Puia dinghuensis]
MRPIEILLVEDNPGDALLAKVAFENSRSPINMHFAVDGMEAIDFLSKKGRFSDAITPDLILLDLNLPKKSGIEVLIEIKADDQLKVIPVIILTTSDAEQDILMSYKLHANSFVNKPFGFESFSEIARSIEKFWFGVVKYPKHD